MTVYVNPCSVSTYSATTRVTSITYYVGDPTLIAGHYAFEENPLCGYPKTVTVTDLPSFATHNRDSSDFTILATTDLNLIGDYKVIVKSQICVPDDYLSSSCTQKTD